MNNITVKIHAEILAEYENYVVMAMFLDGKFSKVLTIDLNQE